jgi:catechol 2,3-dioxygenase-like lactoylglutathione lyase family enzyme
VNASAITAVLPAEDMGRARAFYADRVGLQATDGVAGVTVGDGDGRLFLYPAEGRSPGTFTQAALHVPDVRVAVKELLRRGVAFEEYDTPLLKTVDGVATMPDGDDAAWFKDSEGNLLVVVPAR